MVNKNKGGSEKKSNKVMERDKMVNVRSRMRSKRGVTGAPLWWTQCKVASDRALQ